MQKFLRLSILFVSLLAFLFVFNLFNAHAQTRVRFPDTCINYPGCGLTVPPNLSYCPQGGPLGIISDKDSDPIRDAEFTFIHAPIDTFKYPDRIEISGYLEPEFACFNFPGHLIPPPNQKYEKDVNRYEMPCDRNFKVTTNDISVGITVHSAGVPHIGMPPADIVVFRDTILSGTQINTCSTKFRYKGPFLTDGPTDVLPVNSKARYDLRFQNRTDRTYFYLKIDKEFFFTVTLGQVMPAFDKYWIADQQCSKELCNYPSVIPPTSTCESSSNHCCFTNNDYNNPKRSLAPGYHFRNCSAYLDFIQSITSFDIEIHVGTQTWSAFDVPVDLSKLTCCRSVNKQELDFK